MPDDIVTARTREGYDLPVIDVTHPRFAVADDPRAARALYDAFVASERRQRFIPPFVMRLMLRSAAKKSRLIRAVFDPQAGFLDGLSTYVMKLGADNLVAPYDSPMDRRLAASPHIGLLRLRMQQTARLVADGLVDDLVAAGGATLHLINIGGGPALDSINAIIWLNHGRPALLERSIVIHVLDSQEDGPFFGANALEALKQQGRPLHGLDIAFEHRRYDWDAPASLAQLVRELTAAGGVIAASSEGALFEYGSDEAIIANLTALRADGAGARLVAGSVTRDDATRRRMIGLTGFKLHPRGVEGFAPLAARAGFGVAKVEEAWLSEQVLLRPLR
jgi:hypothetical protein